MKQFKAGLLKLLKGVLGGIALSLIMQALKEFDLIPSEIAYLFTIIAFLCSLITLLSFWRTGVLFILGWILGAWLLKSVLSEDTFIISFVAPIVILLLRGMLFIRKHV